MARVNSCNKILDHFDHTSNDWSCYPKIKIMKKNSNIFFDKKILIYGLGKSGLSTFKFLKNKNDIFLYDDFRSNLKNFLSYKSIIKTNFDHIIISPGIDINKCHLSKFLKKNKSKIYSDLDVFYSHYKNDCITITGTNGKSTTCKLLYEILSKNNYDVRLVGNIGNPILSSKNIKSKTMFIVEASSYQLEYSKMFKSKYGAILNISPDHLERHKTIKRYVEAKFKLLKNQPKKSFCFIKKDDVLTKKYLRAQKLNCKIIKVNTNSDNMIFRKLKNNYILSEANKENLLFVLAILEKFKIKKSLLINFLRKFKGLKYRQQIIYKTNNMMIINDSKSTSFASSLGALKMNTCIYWILGGIHKKGDKFNLIKKYHNNVNAFIFGKDKKFFAKQLKGKIKYRNFKNLSNAFNEAFNISKKQKSKHKVILFSPSAASFDNFKNFEHRGLYFNKLVKKCLNV